MSDLSLAAKWMDGHFSDVATDMQPRPISHSPALVRRATIAPKNRKPSGAILGTGPQGP
ncbi:hypothetical protein JKG47_05040 [Acidithiobacillus sp. MC6.1]|nr:hypothetical protein [Acidithiobacillus sp. MC6.1]